MRREQPQSAWHFFRMHSWLIRRWFTATWNHKVVLQLYVWTYVCVCAMNAEYVYQFNWTKNGDKKGVSNRVHIPLLFDWRSVTIELCFHKNNQTFGAKSCQRVESSPNELRQWQMRTTVQWIALDYRRVLPNIYSIFLCNSHLYSIYFIICWNRTISNAAIKENWIKKIKKSN